MVLKPNEQVFKRYCSCYVVSTGTVLLLGHISSGMTCLATSDLQNQYPFLNHKETTADIWQICDFKNKQLVLVTYSVHINAHSHLLSRRSEALWECHVTSPIASDKPVRIHMIARESGKCKVWSRTDWGQFGELGVCVCRLQDTCLIRRGEKCSLLSVLFWCQTVCCTYNKKQYCILKILIRICI